MSFGKEIKKARADKGWQQKDLREVVGISQKYLSEIECDKVDPRLSIAVRLAEALHVSLDQLTERKETATP